MAKNVVKQIWNAVTGLFETVYPRTVSSNVLHNATTVEVELNNKADMNHDHDAEYLKKDTNVTTTGIVTAHEVIAGQNSGSIALTINDGYGNSNVTFNHKDGKPDQDGNAARIQVNTDATTGATLTFGVKSGVSKDVTVDVIDIMKITETGATILGKDIHHSGKSDAMLYHTATGIAVASTGWTSLNGQYYKDVSDTWFNGASDEWVNISVMQVSYENALVLTGHAETYNDKIRLWALAEPSGTITINYQAQRGVG